MHIFIAGVMQADRQDHLIEEQDYRLRITQALKTHFPEAQISDPWALNPGSVDYDEQRARKTFHAMTRLAGEADVLLAYLPLPSMGTAMEMWQAHNAGAYIVAVTPYVHHWAVRFVADEILPDLDALVAAIENGRLHHWLQKRRRS